MAPSHTRDSEGSSNGGRSLSSPNLPGSTLSKRRLQGVRESWELGSLTPLTRMPAISSNLAVSSAFASSHPQTHSDRTKESSLYLDPRECRTQHLPEAKLPPELLPVGSAARGDGGKRVELVEESLGLRLRKKLRSSPHLRDSDFPEPEWPNSLSLILGWRFCVGWSCWMKSPRCVS